MWTRDTRYDLQGSWRKCYYIRRTNLGSECHQDENLQCLQNNFLRICTHTHSNCGANHLYMETETLPIKVKLEMLCCQFLASACCPSHPLNPIVWSPPRPHPMKHTLSSKFRALGVTYLDAHRQLPSQVFTRTFIQLHSYFVRVGICSLGPNRVLGHRLPIIHHEAHSLPTLHRRDLGRLRSGFRCNLMDYQFLIGCSRDDQCSSCGASPQDTFHLFNCPVHPTALTVNSLWPQPRLVADFLVTLPFFSHLPPLDPPRPRGV